MAAAGGAQGEGRGARGSPAAANASSSSTEGTPHRTARTAPSHPNSGTGGSRAGVATRVPGAEAGARRWQPGGRPRGVGRGGRWAVGGGRAPRLGVAPAPSGPVRPPPGLVAMRRPAARTMSGRRLPVTPWGAGEGGAAAAGPERVVAAAAGRASRTGGSEMRARLSRSVRLSVRPSVRPARAPAPAPTPRPRSPARAPRLRTSTPPPARARGC